MGGKGRVGLFERGNLSERVTEPSNRANAYTPCGLVQK